MSNAYTTGPKNLKLCYIILLTLIRKRKKNQADPFHVLTIQKLLFLTAILHRGLMNDFFFQPIYFSQFLFGLLSTFSK
jgi:hypothetical protein